MEQIGKNTPWIQLAYDSSVAPAKSATSPSAHESQFSLPLPESDVLIIINADAVTSSRFQSTLHSVKPAWIFDVRAAPRLDRLGGSREVFLADIKNIGAQYVDIFGILNIHSYNNTKSNPISWVPVIQDYLRSSDIKRGPFFALLDDETLIDSVSRSLAPSISEAVGRKVFLSNLVTSSNYI